jgi:hypothetical protein
MAVVGRFTSFLGVRPHNHIWWKAWCAWLGRGASFPASTPPLLHRTLFSLFFTFGEGAHAFPGLHQHPPLGHVLHQHH